MLGPPREHCAIAFGQSPPAAAPKAAEPYTPPRTADGQPDIEGSWQPRAGGAAYSVLPHAGGFFLGSESKTGIVEGGVLPYQPWAAEEVKHLTEHMELDPTGHCHYEGIPHAMYFGFQIIQTPKFIAFLHDNMHARRLVYLDGKPHPPGLFGMDGRFARPLGRKHAGGGCRRQQRQVGLRYGGAFSQRRSARSGTIYDRRQRHHRLRSDVRRSQGIHASVQDEISNEEIGQSCRSRSNRIVSAASAIRSISSTGSPI